MAVTVRYPGRLCLLGEHNDWAGGASLVLPMPMGIGATAEEGANGLEVEASLEDEWLRARFPAEGEVDPDGGPLRFVGAAMACLSARGLSPAGARLHIDSDLPAGRGFSSSAAVTLASLDALARLSGVVMGPDELAELAYVTEHTLLGVPCGLLDQLACAHARPLYLRWFCPPRGAPIPSVRPIASRATLHLVAACFPRPRATRTILTALREAVEGDLRDAIAAERARAVHTAFALFADSATTGARCLMEGDTRSLGALLDLCQAAYDEELAEHLPALAAPGLRAICLELRRHGALGAKFSGAGGDGSVIALMDGPDTAKAAVDLLNGRGLRAWYCPTPGAT